MQIKWNMKYSVVDKGTLEKDMATVSSGISLFVSGLIKRPVV